MKRGEVWTVSAGGPYAGKPRPAVIVQEDRFEATNSITICAFTTDPTDAPLLRMMIEPSDRNGLTNASRLMPVERCCVRRFFRAPRRELWSSLICALSGNAAPFRRALSVGPQ
jgi:mRNA-degrading endonuclease toxin of MazEF toxin-antitoxin module